MKILNSLLVALGLTAGCTNAASAPPAMKEIVYGGGLVRFELPQDWIEESDEDGGRMYYREGENTGTLRLSVITASAKDKLPENDDIEILKTTKGVIASDIRRLENGNAMAGHIAHATEQGTQITLFWWHVTNVIPPNSIRIANFSYTVLTSKEKDAETKREVEMLGNSIQNALFHGELGQNNP